MTTNETTKTTKTSEDKYQTSRCAYQELRDQETKRPRAQKPKGS
jgi:ABC-type transporter lipoprotein component MlaA